MLVISSISFVAISYGQNLLVNSNFQQQHKCCEYNIYHPVGWHALYGFIWPIKVQNKKCLKIYCFNDSTGYTSFLVGSIIKPIAKNENYKLKIRLVHKERFRLYIGAFKQFNLQYERDTSELSKLSYQVYEIIDKSDIEVSFSPQVDSAAYIVLKFEELNSKKKASTNLFAYSIELIDPTEEKENLSVKYQQRIKEIYAETRRHDFTVPCQSNTTLRR